MQLCCPHCGKALGNGVEPEWDGGARLLVGRGYARAFGRIQAQIFELLWEAGNRPVRVESLVAAIYGSDPNGGPTHAAKGIHVMVWMLRRRLAPFGLTITKGNRRDGYRLMGRS